MTYARALDIGNGTSPWENLRWELALRTKKPACASMIAQKPYRSYTLALILSAGTLMYNSQILPGFGDLLEETYLFRSGHWA